MAIEREPRSGQVDWDGFVRHMEELAWRLRCVYRGKVSYNAFAKELGVSPTTLSAINRHVTAPGRDLCRVLAEKGGEDERVWLDLAGFLPGDVAAPPPDSDLEHALKQLGTDYTPRELAWILIGLGLSPEAALALKAVGRRYQEEIGR